MNYSLRKQKRKPMWRTVIVVIAIQTIFFLFLLNTISVQNLVVNAIYGVIDWLNI